MKYYSVLKKLFAIKRHCIYLPAEHHSLVMVFLNGWPLGDLLNGWEPWCSTDAWRCKRTLVHTLLALEDIKAEHPDATVCIVRHHRQRNHHTSQGPSIYRAQTKQTNSALCKAQILLKRSQVWMQFLSQWRTVQFVHCPSLWVCIYLTVLVGRKRQKRQTVLWRESVRFYSASKWSLVFTLHQVSHRHNGAFNVGWNCEVREKWGAEGGG